MLWKIKQSCEDCSLPYFTTQNFVTFFLFVFNFALDKYSRLLYVLKLVLTHFSLQRNTMKEMTAKVSFWTQDLLCTQTMTSQNDLFCKCANSAKRNSCRLYPGAGGRCPARGGRPLGSAWAERHGGAMVRWGGIWMCILHAKSEASAPAEWVQRYDTNATIKFVITYVINTTALYVGIHWVCSLDRLCAISWWNDDKYNINTLIKGDY